MHRSEALCRRRHQLFCVYFVLLAHYRSSNVTGPVLGVRSGHSKLGTGLGGLGGFNASDFDKTTKANCIRHHQARVECMLYHARSTSQIGPNTRSASQIGPNTRSAEWKNELSLRRIAQQEPGRKQHRVRLIKRRGARPH